jgi:aminopeptidase N
MRCLRRVVPAFAVLALAAGCTGTTKPPAAPKASGPSPAAAIDGNYQKWAAGASTPVADPIYPQYGNPAIDTLHYDLAIRWSQADAAFMNTATIQLRAAKPVARITLDFGHGFTVDAATVDGIAVTATRAGDKLSWPKPLPANGYATVTLAYHGRSAPVPMPSHRSDAFDLGINTSPDGGIWTMQEPFGAFTWYPVNDQPSDKALYDIAVTAPAGMVGIASGTPAGQSGHTYRYTSNRPVASYLTTLAVGRYTKQTAIGPHGLALTYWFLPTTPSALRGIAAQTPQFLSWLEAHFGPYPFDTAGVVFVDGPSAMETQQLVTFGLAGWDLSNARALTAATEDMLHEYSHQWFGDTVTTNSWQGMWLNEGWAMYAQLLYRQERDHLSDAEVETRLREADRSVRARSGPPGQPQPGNYGEGNVYYCPALMLFEIHQALGDEAFFAMARAWVTAHRDTSQDRAAFTAFVNAQTGHDFTALIDRYLDSTTTPPS